MTAERSSKNQDETQAYLGKVIASRYRVEALLGEGGMGVVYRARHVLIERVVALKLIRPDLRKETHLRAWMLREARAANRVDHAHIVEIHDVGETDEGELYLVMEYLVGQSLASNIAQGPLPLGRAVDILEQMCAALARAHDLGVIHRDLKSDNIMLTVRGGRQDFVKILDFGLAAITHDPRLAPKGAVFGTPEYMAPEQARGEDASALCDLYSLGVLFFEMLSGRLPFRSRSREEMLEMQRSAPAPSVRSLQADVSEKADEIIQRLLKKNPAERFRDAHHLQEELKALQRSLPSTPWDVRSSEAPAPPPPPAPSPGVVEWSRRAANFLRLTARAYPDGKAPEAIQQLGERMWDLAGRASKLEGELASHSRKLQGIERRGRGLRAELGRKVEDLAQEESRAMREASAERERAAVILQGREQAQRDWSLAHRQAELSAKTADMAAVRRLFEAVGATKARVEALGSVADDYEQRALRRERDAQALRQQIEELRGQLRRYSEVLENELASGRDRIGQRVREALSFEKGFSEASAELLAHFRGRPEYREMIQDFDDEKPADASSRAGGRGSPHAA